jgi:hypothetical protein
VSGENVISQLRAFKVNVKKAFEFVAKDFLINNFPLEEEKFKELLK